ncbi:MAG: membrane protein insertase YidC [Clostridia bacterium]|nr:membrane protein insertase YidC [Clostridia bacterium]
MIDKILYGLGQVIAFFDGLTGSYVVAMLAFALITEIVLLPFGIKQQKNSIKQAKLRPKEMAIRNKYKGRNDQATMQKMNQEIQEFYQKENFNPAAGCLPLLIQLPIVLALYRVIVSPLKYVIGFSAKEITKIVDVINGVYEKAGTAALEAKLFKNNDIELIGKIKENFEVLSQEDWFTEKIANISDLPDFTVFGGLDLGDKPSSVGLSLSWILLVPVLVFLSQFLYSKLIRKFTYQPPSAQDANMGCSNTVMDITMPLMTTYFSYIMPGAVGIYWVFKNIISFIRQILMVKLMPYPKFTEEDYKAAEKEVNSKTKKNEKVQKSGRVVRSLHHIDDEDFEDTREKALEFKAKLEAQEAEEKAKREAKNALLSGKIKVDDKKSENVEEKKDDKEEQK